MRDGLLLPADSPYQLFTLIFTHLRMPLFAFLSGFVYAYRPVGADKLAFLKKKLKRLGIPLLVVTALYTLMEMFPAMRILHDATPQSGRLGLLQNYVYGYHHLWFLQAILLIFVLVVVLEHWIGSFRNYLLALAGASLLHLIYKNAPYVFSIYGAVYLLPLFLLGLGANRFRAQFWATGVRGAALAVFLVTAGIYLFLCYTGDAERFAGRESPLGLLLSAASCLVVIYWIPGVHWLAWIGTFSFGIYLYHYFFTVGTGVILRAAGVVEVAPNFALAMAFGVLGPVLLEIAVRRSAIARRVLLGQS